MPFPLEFVHVDVTVEGRQCDREAHECTSNGRQSSNFLCTHVRIGTFDGKLVSCDKDRHPLKMLFSKQRTFQIKVICEQLTITKGRDPHLTYAISMCGGLERSDAFGILPVRCTDS